MGEKGKAARAMFAMFKPAGVPSHKVIYPSVYKCGISVTQLKSKPALEAHCVACRLHYITSLRMRVFLVYKIGTTGASEMPQCTKWLPKKHEDLCVNPQNPYKVGEAWQKHRNPRKSRPVSLVNLLEKRPCLTQGWRHYCVTKHSIRRCNSCLLIQIGNPGHRKVQMPVKSSEFHWKSQEYGCHPPWATAHKSWELGAHCAVCRQINNNNKKQFLPCRA